MRLVLVFALGCVCLFGCSDTANRYYGTRYAPVSPKSVEVLSDAPATPYDVIADFQSRSDFADNYMRDEAAKVGADAVIITHLGGYVPKGNTRPDEGTYHDALEDRVVGTAIRYKR